jgi:cytochrome b
MENAEAPARRWDPIVKITHWGIVSLVICNALLVGDGSIAHIYAGYLLAALLALRLVWGLIGPAPARFGSFPPSPRRAIKHVGDIIAGRKETHHSHNPLGALMVYAVWACLSVIVATGVAMSGPPPAVEFPISTSSLVSREEHGEDEVGRHERGEREHEGESGEGESEEALEELHEAAVNLLYLLIFLHIAGVAFETARSGKRTLTAMLPGGK